MMKYNSIKPIEYFNFRCKYILYFVVNLHEVLLLSLQQKDPNISAVTACGVVMLQKYNRL